MAQMTAEATYRAMVRLVLERYKAGKLLSSEAAYELLTLAKAYIRSSGA